MNEFVWRLLIVFPNNQYCTPIFFSFQNPQNTFFTQLTFSIEHSFLDNIQIYSYGKTQTKDFISYTFMIHIDVYFLAKLIKMKALIFIICRHKNLLGYQSIVKHV